ncbi:HAD hydrolase family protein [Salininema proteolyticum]|uniref:HAD hydrolase family protein n=1 Tax=Salininema proteolyticum TaxID=1607685 RepID=A0ABV8U2R4_9ACTN
MTSTDLPRVVVTDMDGTVVRRDETVSDRTKEAFERLAERGVTVIAATGRGPRLQEWTLSQIPAAHHLVMGQGAFVYDTHANDRPVQLASQYVSGRVLADAVGRIEEQVDNVFLVAESADPDAPLRGDEMPVWPWELPRSNTPREEALAGEFVKLYFWPESLDSDTVLEKASPLLEGSPVGITESGVGILELGPAGMDKWRGIEPILDRLDAGWHDVLAFGDAINDLGMLERAGRAVAMPQGHRRVIDTAPEAAPGDNDQDGVAQYIERLLGD